MTPLRITAHLLNGFAASDPWSPAIDAIIGWAHLRRQMGEDEFQLAQWDDSAMQPVTGLPIAVERDGGLWWYQASSPQYRLRAQFLRWYHRRFDAAMAEQYMIPTKGRIQTQCGPYKNARLSSRVQVCDRVTWNVVGDHEVIRDLLRDIHAIGSRIGAGNGRVRSWEVAEDGDERLARFHRPLPADFAQRHGLSGPLLEWGMRPPGRLPQNQALCIMPGE